MADPLGVYFLDAVHDVSGDRAEDCRLCGERHRIDRRDHAQQGVIGPQRFAERQRIRGKKRPDRPERRSKAVGRLLETELRSP